MSFTFPRLGDRRNAATEVLLVRTLSVTAQGDSELAMVWGGGVAPPPSSTTEESTMSVFGIPQTRAV